MEEHNIFSEAKEIQRLQTQNQLMYPCETAILRELLAGRTGLTVLDVGSNDGEKTACWFNDPAVARVVGLEFNAALARQAQADYGNEVFNFYHCDVEADTFPAQMEDIMRREDIRGFDVIYLSFVMSHLRAPDALLRRLRPLLLPGGILIAVDSDDSQAVLAPEGGDLFREYLGFLAEDPYGGDRSFGCRIPQVLADCGFDAPAVRCNAVTAGPEEREKREKIFETYSFYLEDLPILREERPGDQRCDYIERWMEEHYPDLKRCFLSEEAQVSMGIIVVTCTAEADNF